MAGQITDNLNKKIGILTLYHNNYNFGGLLQAYALQKVIAAMGYDAEQICYDSVKKDSKKDKSGVTHISIDKIMNDVVRIIKINVKEVLNFVIRCKIKRRLAAFKDFMILIPHSAKIYTSKSIKDSIKEYDGFVCGGDQIWNDWTGWLEEDAPFVYSLSFVPETKRKFSYAPSTGGAAMSKTHLKKLEKGLKSLDYVSVRERSSQSQIMSICGHPVSVVLDPTLLLGEEQWEEMIQGVNITDSKYGVCYFLGNDSNQKKAATDYLHRNNCMVLSFPYIFNNGFCKSDGKYGDIYDVTSGPKEFLAIIKNSQFVITDSFHAVVFSFIFHKPFYVMERDMQVGEGTMNSRIYDFLHEFHLESRLISATSLSKMKEWQLVDYAEADRVLAARKEESMEFLRTALSDFV